MDLNESSLDDTNFEANYTDDVIDDSMNEKSIRQMSAYKKSDLSKELSLTSENMKCKTIVDTSGSEVEQQLDESSAYERSMETPDKQQQISESSNYETQTINQTLDETLFITKKGKKNIAIIDSDTSDSEDETRDYSNTSGNSSTQSEHDKSNLRKDNSSKTMNENMNGNTIVDASISEIEQQLDKSDQDDTESFVGVKKKKKIAIIDSDESASEDETRYSNTSGSSTNQSYNISKSATPKHRQTLELSEKQLSKCIDEISNLEIQTTNKTLEPSFNGRSAKKDIVTIDSDTMGSEDEIKHMSSTTQNSPNDSASKDLKNTTEGNDKRSLGLRNMKSPKSVEYFNRASNSSKFVDEDGNQSKDDNHDKFSNQERGISTPHAMNRSSFIGIRSKKKMPIIDSDESDSESNESSSNDFECARKSPESPEFLKHLPSRLTENFQSRTPASNSTMIGIEVISSDDSDVVEASDEETSSPEFIRPKTPRPIKTPLVQKNLKTPSQKQEPVTKRTYDNQKLTVNKLEMEVNQLQKLLKTTDLSKLPDKGKLLRNRVDSVKSSLEIARQRLAKMFVDTSLQEPSVKATWENLKVESDIVQPRTFGRQALQTHNVQKSLTMERLEKLHGSLANCPKDDYLAEDPEGLRSKLMPYQKHALAWLAWREEQDPSGGILADDMGLGKTLTIISLTMQSLQTEAKLNKENRWRDTEHRDLIQGGTLVVCPASVVKQWEAEVALHCRRPTITVELYHGPKRTTKAKSLSKFDMVITTYSICQNEAEKSTPLNLINWRRIILDEGHQIRNHKSRTALAICHLEGKSRWVLTGTPVHNKELDMYSLLKFLRCTPFDDHGIWKTWIGNKDSGGYQRLQTVISSLMLRRTKEELQKKGDLKSLPDRTWKVVEVKLSEDEMAIYEKVLIFSRTIFAQYLHQRSNKDTANNFKERPMVTKAIQPDNPYYKIYEKLARKIKDVKQHEILLVLLRLRQCCCHPCLITQMLENTDLDDDDDDSGVMNLMEELEKLDIEDQDDAGRKTVEVEITKKFNLENPLFHRDYQSKKIEMVMKTAREIVFEKKEKVIIVSQWTSFLKIIGDNLNKEGIKYEQLDGSLNIDKRMAIVNNINNSSHPTRVLLLSLTAGGVGLNLVGANHLLLVDIHWNPQLESQAQDRIYRMGQTRHVYIYKFVTIDTIEQQVKMIQDYKLSIADSMLTGSKPTEHSKLTLQDLRLLFNM